MLADVISKNICLGYGGGGGSSITGRDEELIFYYTGCSNLENKSVLL